MSKSTIQTIAALFLSAFVPAALFTLGFGLIINSISNASDVYLYSSNPVLRAFETTLSYLVISLMFPFPVAVLHLAALGIPAFLLGWKMHKINWRSVLLISFLIGAIPSSLLLGLTSSSTSSNIWQVVREVGIVGAAMGLLGVSGGMTFWFLWHFWITRSNPDFYKPSSAQNSERRTE
jgi:hypothetical protein